jgi:hypothetical protein
MSDTLQEIRQSVATSPFLLIDADEDSARLLTHGEAMKRLTTGDNSIAIMVDVSRCLASFERLTTGHERFELCDLVKITANPKSTINHWVNVGLIEPTVRPAHGSGRYNTRLFSKADAFRAGLIASLRRHGVALPMIRRVLRLLTTSQVEA